MRDSNAPNRRAVVVASDMSYPAGGAVYARRIFEELASSGWQLAVWTNAPRPTTLKSDRWHVCEDFFRDGHGLSGRLRRRRIERGLLDLVREYRPSHCFVLSDVPRELYRRIEHHAKVVFFLHSVTPTCPQDGGLRYLEKSGKICSHRAGRDCLQVDRTEGCLGQRSWWRKVQRIWNTRKGLRSLGGLDSVVANSEYIADLYRAHNRRIHLKVLEPQVARSDAAAELVDDSGRFTILYLGRVETSKGAIEAVEILARLPQSYRLKVLGEGAAADAVRARASELRMTDRIELAGWANRQRISQEFARCGVLLMPGLVAEAFGLAGPEALCGGLPVVAYDVGGVREWCEGEVARTVAIGDRAAAANAIRDITADAARWQTLRQNARVFATRRFALNVWRNRFAGVIDPTSDEQPIEKCGGVANVAGV